MIDNVGDEAEIPAPFRQVGAVGDGWDCRRSGWNLIRFGLGVPGVDLLALFSRSSSPLPLSWTTMVVILVCWMLAGGLVGP
jgi:hypothetical protein